MLEVRLSRQTSATPGVVLATLKETSPERRVEVWSNVKPKHSELHASGEGFLEITEGTFVVGVFWERSRYEWPDSDRVLGTVLESNVFRPGSTWEVRATPREGGGSDVELTVRRNFQPGPKGRIAKTVNHLGGHRLFGWYLGTVLKAVEEQRSGQP